MTTAWQLSDVASWRGKKVDSQDGERIGVMDEVVYDYKSGMPVWLVVGTGVLGAHLVLVPCSEVEPLGRKLRVAYPRHFIMAQPVVELGEGWSYGEDALLLYEYFAMPLREDDDIRVLHRHDYLPGTTQVTRVRDFLGPGTF